MGEAKRYYWLKLHTDFFDSKRIKKLRKMAGGDTYTIIYLKMQLLAIKTDGVIKYTGLEADFSEELALDLDEETDNVKVVLAYLLSCGLAETSDNINFFFPYAVSNTGSESTSAQRVRAHREKQNLLQCNTDLLQCNADLLQCNVEKEIDIDKEIDIEKEQEKEKELNNPSDCIKARNEPKKRFIPPTVEEVQAYLDEKGYTIDAENFVDYYTARGWAINKNPIKDWKACVRTWNRRENPKPKPEEPDILDGIL